MPAVPTGRFAMASAQRAARTMRQRVVGPALTDLVRRQAMSCGSDLRVNGWSRLNAPVVLGDRVNFNGMRILGCGEVRIGDDFHSGADCLMISQVHDYATGDRLPYGDELLPRPIEIGRFVWLGDRVTILGGARIGDGAIVQAGSVVVGEVPALAIVGGHPAKPFAWRDAEHYRRIARS
ncbi:MAG: acyltransferase [Acidimicrobiales bacterium]